MVAFDPNAAALTNSGIFGLPYSISNAQLVLIPVPWEATCSYGNGSKYAPDSILESSRYIDLYDHDLGNFYEKGIALAPVSSEVIRLNKAAEVYAKVVIEHSGRIEGDNELTEAAKKVDYLSEMMNDYVFNKVSSLLKRGKSVGLIGGNHCTPYGSIKAHINKYPKMGVLQIDAHCDLISSFEGFKYSHASIMENILSDTSLERLIQVGIRGYCEEEFQKIQKSNGRIITFFESDIFASKASGKTWDSICDDIVSVLPQEIYVSFDIDGMDPSLCTNTGTPVPGGLQYQEVNYLLKKIIESKREIVGFDLVEVVPGTDSDWDANVASHLIYKLCGWLLRRTY